MTTTAPTPATDHTATRMPWAALVALAAIGFLLLSAETMPAGLLPLMAGDLGASEGVIGQFISVWALGTVVVTVPAITLTRGIRRKPLLLASLTSGSTDLREILAATSGTAVWAEPAHWCGALAMGLVVLLETGRQPIDNPDTHLELTMIHEGPLLEYAGRDLAYLQWAVRFAEAELGYLDDTEGG